MTSRPEAFVIFNPASGRGRGARRIPRYLELLRRYLGPFEHAATTRAGEEAELAEKALRAGHRLIAAAGGDGTWSQVADRILAHGDEQVTLAILPAGTGNDLAKQVGVQYSDPEGAVRLLVEGETLRIDAGRVLTEPEGGGPTHTRHFHLLTGFGFDVAVLQALGRMRFLRGNLVYKATALREAMTFPGLSLEHRTGTRGATRVKGLMLSVCNGSTIGGSFRIAPSATVTDGKLDVCVVGDAGLLTRLRVLSAAGEGTHERFDIVDHFQTERLEIELDTPQPFHADGEIQPHRTVHARVEVLPGALRIRGKR